MKKKKKNKVNNFVALFFLGYNNFYFLFSLVLYMGEWLKFEKKDYS